MRFLIITVAATVLLLCVLDAAIVASRWTGILRQMIVQDRWRKDGRTVLICAGIIVVAALT